MMNERKTTNMLLLVIALPIVFYILHILSFIFVPLVLSMFIALLFLPLMRWLRKKKVPKTISIIIVVVIIVLILKIGFVLIQLTSNEILSPDSLFFEKAEKKILALVTSLEVLFGVTRTGGDNVLVHYLQKYNFLNNLGATLDLVGGTVSKTLTTVFFVVLWLAESMNFQKLLQNTILKREYSSVKAFMKIEKDLITFVKVKIFVSLMTGIGFSLACVFFEVSFPIFWGLFAFAINFVQMIGSFVSVVLLSLFAFVEIEPTGILLLFILSIIGVQVLFGSILEPVFMGKSFSINVIAILIMLMFWGFIWGIPGLIMSIPLTVFLKIIFEQFPGTKLFARIISG